MKKIYVFSVVALFALTTVQLHGQENQKKTINEKIEQEKKEIKTEKKELKKEKKALRKLDKNDVSNQSKEQFNIDFGNIPNVKWKRSDYFDEATFIKDGKEMTAFYDITSKLVGTTTHKTFEELPAKAQKKIKEKYNDYTVKLVLLFDDNEFNETDMMLYGVQFDDEYNFFVELAKGNKTLIIRVDETGSVYYFKEF